MQRSQALWPGLGVWFNETQKHGTSKLVPAIVLSEPGPNGVVVARGTSQHHDSGGYSAEGAVSLSPSDADGRSLGLTLITQFRADDVKIVQLEAIERTCSRMTRGTWKRVNRLTADKVAQLAESLALPTDPSELGAKAEPSGD